MKDIILEGFVADFSEKYGFSELTQGEQFERFSAYSILSRLHACPDDIDDLILGGERDGGIDSIAICVNGAIISSQKDIDFFIEKFRKLDVEIIFIQSKSSSKFNSGEIGKFLFGVEQILTTGGIALSSEVREVRETILYMLKKSVYMDRLPRLYCYYATAGSWGSPVEISSMMAEYEAKLQSLNLFDGVAVKPIDASTLREYYRATTRANDQVFEFSRVVVLPKMENVSEAYIGAVKAHELLKLITVDDKINKGVFYDNVRDFQGNNAVNKEIAETISSQASENKFVLMNNGVTIVAKTLLRTGESFRIVDYQVVNGCQTSHIVFDQRHNLTESTWIPLKLVITSNQEVTNDVIRATNRQTPVLPEALETLSKFHRDLEDFYEGYPAKFGGPELHYERRSKQYDGTNITPNQVVTITMQIKAFISMFLDEPHSQHRYYGELLDAYRDKIFLEDHLPDPYFCSCAVLAAVEKILNHGEFRNLGRKYKYHVALAIKYSINNGQAPKFSNQSIEEYCRLILKTIEDKGKLVALVKKTLEIIRKLEPKFPVERGNGPLRRKDFTLSLLEQLGVGVGPKQSTGPGRQTNKAPKDKSSLIEGQLRHGSIKWTSDMKGFGMIAVDDADEIFVSLADLREVPWLSWKKDTRVSFTVGRNYRGFCALKVKLDEVKPQN